MLANEFVNRVGGPVGFEQRAFPIDELLTASRDDFILEHLERYAGHCRALLERPL